MKGKIILSIVSSLDKGGVERVAALYAKEFANLGYRSIVYLFNNETVSQRNIKYLPNIELISSEDELDVVLNNEIEFIYIHNNLVPDKLIKLLVSSGHVLVEHCVWSTPDIRFEPSFSFQLSEFALNKYVTSTKYNEFSSTKSVILPNCFELQEFNNYSNCEISDKVIFGRIGQKSMAKWSFKYIEVIRETLKSNKSCQWLLIGCPDTLTNKIKHALKLELERIEFIEEINDDDVLANYYGKIDYFVAISDIGESFGLVLFEAISKGCYVLTLSTPWLDNSQSEYIFESQHGKVFSSVNQLKYFCINNASNKVNKKLSDETSAFLEKFKPSRLTQNLLLIVNSGDINFTPNKFKRNSKWLHIVNQLKYVENLSFFFLIYWLLYCVIGNSSLLNKIYIKIWNRI